MTAAMGPPGLRTLRERKRVADGFVLAAPVALLVASALPWFVLGTDVDVPSLARSTFVATAVLLAAAIAVDASKRPRLVAAALYVSPWTGIAITAFLWHVAGGVAHPGLLTLFALPVLATAVSGRAWAPWVAAGFAMATVGTVALLESPSLAWYFVQWGAPLNPLYDIPIARSGDLAGTSPPQSLTTLVAFGLSMLGVAAFGHAAVRKLTRESVSLALAAPREAGGLWRSALAADPLPLAVVTAPGGRIVAASDEFIERMVVRRVSIPGVELTDVLRFRDSDAVESLLRTGGRLEMTAYAVGPDLRLAAIEARPFEHGGESYRTVTIVDWREVGHLIATADSLESAVLVVGSEDGRLRWANRPARALLGESWMGRDLSQVIADAASGSVQLQGRVFAARSHAVTAAAPDPEALTVIVLDEAGAHP